MTRDLLCETETLLERLQANTRWRALVAEHPAASILTEGASLVLGDVRRKLESGRDPGALDDVRGVRDGLERLWARLEGPAGAPVPSPAPVYLN